MSSAFDSERVPEAFSTKHFALEGLWPGRVLVLVLQRKKRLELERK